MANWTYSGDVNPEHGGIWIDLDSWDDGYCSAVKVTDLDSGCGFTGACLIEHIVILGVDSRERINAAISCCYGSAAALGARNWHATNDREGAVKESLRLAIACALADYGSYDPDDAWDSYQSHHSEIVQMEQDGPMRFDGWKADKRLANTTLQEYVESVHLS